jgi:hypothetical protein
VQVERLLLGVLGLKKFSTYVQEYGAPVGYRIASKHPQAIDAIVEQNGNAYVEGIGAAFDPMKPFWANRNAETEKPVRGLLTLATTTFQYTYGAKDRKRSVRTIGHLTRSSSIAREMTRSNSTCSTTINPTRGLGQRSRSENLSQNRNRKDWGTPRLSGGFSSVPHPHSIAQRDPIFISAEHPLSLVEVPTECPDMMVLRPRWSLSEILRALAIGACT